MFNPLWLPFARRLAPRSFRLRKILFWGLLIFGLGPIVLKEKYARPIIKTKTVIVTESKELGAKIANSFQ
jgi:hypothetical protein